MDGHGRGARRVIYRRPRVLCVSLITLTVFGLEAPARLDRSDFSPVRSMAQGGPTLFEY